ncbi:dynein axonemal assembly factor 5 [Homalodisca vitripennis]|nr:dynein axonemal assembly factor 5 [Homalodisca vitripennis]
MAQNNSDEILLYKYCNELGSDNKKQRKTALDNIRKEILNKNTDIISSFEKCKKHVIRCFNDSSENVREYAVVIMIEILRTVPVEDSNISLLMPAIHERLCGEVGESSEEVRLCLVNLLSILIECYKNQLPGYLNEFISIFVKTIVDPYPKVKIESCSCVTKLAMSIPQHFHMQSETLIPPLIQTLTYQQYRVRIAGVNSIGAVVRYGNNKSVSDVCGPLAERLFDQHHAVRMAVARVVGLWLLELHDRYSYFHKLIPLMLTSLTEEIPEHRKEVEELWDKVGKQFLIENENDLKDKIDYLQEKLEHYPPNTERPNLGCRTLVQRELSKYLPAVTLELDDWKADIRVKSAQLLCVTVQHAESCITQHLEKTLPALYRACGDPDTRVSDNIELAAQMVGYFVPPDVYCRLILPSVEEMTSAGVLRVLAAVLRSSVRCQVQPELSAIVEKLSLDAVCHSRQAGYQQQLLNVVSTLQQVSQEDLISVTQNLFVVTISVLGLATEASITGQAQEVMKGLADCNGITVQELYERHTSALLEQVAVRVQDWTLHSPQRYVFEALLTNAGAAVGQNMDRILDILEGSLQPDLEPEATLQMLMAVSYVVTHSAETLSGVTDVSQIIHSLCTRVLQPQLVWRAGRAAEALRTAAVGCVVAALALLTCPRSLVEPLLPLLLALVEDSAYKTRQFASVAVLNIVKSLRTLEALTAQDIDTIYPVIMKRLDDNNDAVRETAVQTLSQLFSTPLPPDYSVECHRASLEVLFDTMLLHLDDPVPSFQDIILNGLRDISCIHPQLLKSRIQKDNFRNKCSCQQLIGFLEGQLHI